MHQKIIMLIMLSVFSLLLTVSTARVNDACFGAGCHSDEGASYYINKTRYNANSHELLECIDCHNGSLNPLNEDHGKLLLPLYGTTLTGSLGFTQYNSSNYRLCYYCHNETKLIGLPQGYSNALWTHRPSPGYPLSIDKNGTNFVNELAQGYNFGNYPANIHWDHLDMHGINYDQMWDSNRDGTLDSMTSCTACHEPHGNTNRSALTKNDLGIEYGSDADGEYGIITSLEYLNQGGDVYCNGCHGSSSDFKYYRTKINLLEDCVSCHADGVSRDFNRTAFGQGVHVNINTSEGLSLVNNSDCYTCHFKKDMNRSNIRQCADCHTGSGRPDAPTAPKIRTHLPAVTNYSCSECHSKVTINPGEGIVNVTSHYALRPTVPTSNYCDYCHGPDASSPFKAVNKTIPEFAHDDPGWDGNATCRTCHANSSVSADPLANDASSFHDLTTELGDVNGSVKADCVLCHVQKSPQFVAAPSPPHDITGMTADDCRGCHTAGAGTQAQKLHIVTAFATGGCITCHSNNETRYYVNTSLFGLHANVNTSDGPNNVTDDDCKTCHFGSANGTMKMLLAAANQSNTYFCQDCHTSAGTGPIKPTDPNLIKNGLSHGKTDCKWCHIAGDPLPRPLTSQLRYHPNGPRGTAAGRNCVSCHYSANLPDLPFHAPGEGHASDTGGCQYCHNNADNHAVTPLNQHSPPMVSGFFVSTPVTAGIRVQVQFTVSDDMLQIAAAQYQVTNSSGTVIDWTNMTPQDGRFNSMSDVANATIDISGLLGTYNVNVKGMASAPRTDPLKPYYPLNGQWSSVSSTQLIVVQPIGYDNGTVYGTLGNNIAGAIVSTATGISTTTNATGFYSMSLANGTYQLTASKEPEYYPNNSVTVTVTAFTTVTQNIILTLKPTGNIVGEVRNA